MEKHDTKFLMRINKKLLKDIRRTALEKDMSAAEYIRIAVVEKMEKEGV